MSIPVVVELLPSGNVMVSMGDDEGGLAFVITNSEIEDGLAPRLFAERLELLKLAKE